MFGLKRENLIIGCKRLYDEELYGYYCPPDFICWIKYLRMRWTGHVAHIGGRIGACRVMVGIT